MKKYILIITLLFGQSLLAVGNSPVWGLGYFSQYMNELSGDSSSKKTTLGKMMIPVVYKSNINLFGSNYMWHASLAGLLPEIKTNDDAANYYLLQFGLASKWRDSGGSAWFYGGGLNYAILKGAGGSVTLNNGSGTATFYLPKNTTSSKTFYAEFGYMTEFSAFRLDTSLQFDNLLGDSRSYSLLANFLFPLGL